MELSATDRKPGWISPAWLSICVLMVCVLMVCVLRGYFFMVCFLRRAAL